MGRLTLIEFEIIDSIEVANLILVSVYDKYPSFPIAMSQKEKENLFSVRGFETETSNFAPNGCLRVSIN